MRAKRLTTPDVGLLAPKIFGDDKGFIFQSSNISRLGAAGINVSLAQEDHLNSPSDMSLAPHYQVSSKNLGDPVYYPNDGSAAPYGMP